MATGTASARKVPATVDSAVLDKAVKVLRFGGGAGDLSPAIEEAINEAVSVYVRTRRDPAAFREAVIARIPVITRAVDYNLRESIRAFIRHDEATVREFHAAAHPTLLQRVEAEDAASAAEGLPFWRTIQQWLYPKDRDRKRSKSPAA